jgi:hypothetical protein
MTGTAEQVMMFRADANDIEDGFDRGSRTAVRLHTPFVCAGQPGAPPGAAPTTASKDRPELNGGSR